MGLMVLLVAVFQISVTAVAYKDITFFNAKALPNITESIIIGGYSAGSDRTTSFTYGRVIDTGTGAALPSGVTYANQGGNARKMTIQAGSDLPGVYYCDHSGFRLQTVLVASQAEIHPGSQTKTVSWGDDVTLTMTIQSTSISESQLKWKHNGVDIEAWNGQSSITITSAKPSDAGIYECYTSQQQRQDGLNGFMRLIVRRCPNGKYGETCLFNCPRCYNGGICNADTGECICPPGFKRDDCNIACDQGYWGKSCELKCSSTNTDTACKGKIFCVSDPYGCSCLASQGGLDCNTDCPPGKYGAGCTQTCHCTNGCNEQGICIGSSGDCHAGWTGGKCKNPSSCSNGLYGQLCNYNCHCENNAACNKNTGFCLKGDCAPGWINLDTIHSDCQQDGSLKFRRFVNHKVNPGEVTNFYCEVSGNPVFDSNDLKIWKYGTSDYLTLNNTGSSKYIVFGNSTSVVVDSGDMYSCGNSIGFSGSISVQFYGLPRFNDTNKPYIDVVNFDQLTVTWNKWTTNDIGDGPVESYKVYYRESGESDWISGQVTPVSDTSQMSYTSTITGLQWSTQYEITVTVKRPGPLGEGSKDITITAETKCATPQEPTIGDVSSPGLKQLEVHVQVPDSSDIKCKKDSVNGYIDYIEVKYRETGTADEYETGKREVYQEIVTGTKVITFTAESLLPYTDYDVIALLRNADATSSESNSLTVISHEDVPSKPRNVTLQPAVYTITVTWLEPDPPNGIITSYKITYWKTGDERTKIDIPVDAHEHNINDLANKVNYTVIVSAYTSVGEGEYSDEMNTKTTETIPHEPASIDVQSTTENSIRFTWTDPTIFSGDILQHSITYKSTESVYSTTVLESKDILIEGSIHTHTLEELPPGTQFQISVSASTSKGFGKPKSIISGTKIGLEVSGILEEPHVTNEPVFTETTATIDFRKSRSNTDIKTDTELLSYIVVVEEKRQKKKRDLEKNMYITASFPLNEIPDQLIVGDGMEYNGYINKPLTPGQHYVIYDGVAVYTTGVEEILLTDEPITSFKDGVLLEQNRSNQNGDIIGAVVSVIMVCIVIAAILVAVFIIRRRLRKQKRSNEHEASGHNVLSENAYVNVDTMITSSERDNITPFTDKETGESQYMNITITPTKVPTPEPTEPTKPRSLPPKPKPKAKPIHNSQYTIQVKDLADYVIKKREENDFVAQFKLLPKSENTEISYEAARIPENKSKNRFRNVLSYDHSRVVLDVINDDPNSDYINANYIDGYQKNNAYIATQGTNDITIKDFWRMVLKENVATILMATNLSEGGKIKCIQYWPDKGSKKYGSISVTLVKSEQFPDYFLRTINVKQENSDQEHEVKQFHFTVWPDMGVPIYATGVLAVLQHINSVHDVKSGPMVVHCSAGVGRTGSFISIDSMLKMAKAEGCIDVFNFVKRGRENRMNFVQTAEQYEFIHTAVMEATLCGDTSIPASDFRQIYGKLQTVDRKTKKSQLQVQWENLGKVSRKPRADEWEVGKLEENSAKNRFNNILPFDRRRLRLMTPVYDDEFSTDYINASFVSAYTVKESFMVTQMPLPNTIVDLWRMVYDYKSTSIVMLNDMNHNDMTLGQYWPDEGVMQCGPFLLETVKTDNMKNITTRTIHLTNANGVVQIIQQFQVTCWPADQEFPTSKSVIVDLMSMVEKWQKQTGNGPVTVHCINGIGRCGVYCASVSTCDRIKVDQMVDIFQAVKALRANRPHMVESMAQYKYCHDVILDYFESFDTYSNFQ